MTQKEAISQLNFGYILIIGGILLGILTHKALGQSSFVSAFMCSYFFWSVYWGYKIMYKRFYQFFNAPIHIHSEGTLDYFSKSIVFKITSEFFKFWICYFVGAFGGAIIKQILLSKIAYF
ncbi:hypothetical protein [Mesoflavibacter zeaxanthinifaciens]|jgi:hypothetical protein|uniref:hypothetical protein n=1 Tax=Mesoflavibacter zeaxanthinifaciens TaxID=393060 RepID=UPI003A90B49C